jgi:hypothetical protein
LRFWEVVRSVVLRFTGSLAGGDGGVCSRSLGLLCQQIIYRSIPSYTLRPSASSSTGDAWWVLLRPWSLSWGNMEAQLVARITVNHRIIYLNDICYLEGEQKLPRCF